MEVWLSAHWLTILIALATLFIAHMMGRSDGEYRADKRDGTLRQDSVGRLWVLVDDKWEQLWFEHKFSGVRQPIKIEFTNAQAQLFTRPVELSLPPAEEHLPSPNSKTDGSNPSVGL